MDDERLHQAGPKMLKTVLRWAEQLDDSVVRPVVKTNGSNVLLNDLADRIRARGLNVAVDYGFDNGSKLPLVVGLNDKPFACLPTMRSSWDCSPPGNATACFCRTSNRLAGPL